MINRISVGIVFALFLALVVVLVGAGEEKRMPAQEEAYASRSVENGASIFADACSGCHGIQGQGIPGVAPSLNSAAFFTTRLEEVGWSGSLRSYVESTVEAGRPVGSGQYSAVMPTWGQAYGGPLRPDQIYDVTSYVLNWEATAEAGEAVAARPSPTPLPADASPVEIGQAVYENAGCIGCHGEPGGAGIVGPSLGGIASRAGDTVPGLSAEEYILQSIVQPNAYLVPECPTGACVAGLMPQNYSDQLSEQELDGLVQYLLKLE